MKVLVTGANGFLANNVIRELNKRSVPLRAMVRSTADTGTIADLAEEIFRGDFTIRESAEKAVKGCDAVIHLAADTSQHYSLADLNEACNVNGTRNLLEASTHNGIKRFIYVSTANAFAHGTMESPGDENKPLRYPFTRSGYAISKVRAQEMALAFGAESGMDVIVVNPTFMIGPHDHKPSSGRIITMMYRRKMIPVPAGGKNFIHVSDAATAICNALSKGRCGHCYLLANENITYYDFYQRMGAIAGRKYMLLKLGSSLLKTAGLFGDGLNRLGIPMELNTINAKILCEGNYFSNAKAVSELDLPSTSVDTAISDALEWFGRNGYLKK